MCNHWFAGLDTKHTMFLFGLLFTQRVKRVYQTHTHTSKNYFVGPSPPTVWTWRRRRLYRVNTIRVHDSGTGRLTKTGFQVEILTFRRVNITPADRLVAADAQPRSSLTSMAQDRSPVADTSTTAGREVWRKEKRTSESQQSCRVLLFHVVSRGHAHSSDVTPPFAGPAADVGGERRGGIVRLWNVNGRNERGTRAQRRKRIYRCPQSPWKSSRLHTHTHTRAVGDNRRA